MQKMKDLKINTTLIILVTTLICLFGGHFIYQSQFIEKPLHQVIKSIPDVSIKHIAIQPKSIKIIATTNYSFSLKRYPELQQRILDIIGNRRIEIQLMGRSDSVIDTAWQQMVFGVKEGIYSKKFTQIYSTVTVIAKMNNIKSVVFMDERNIYIELRHKSNYLFKVYPLDKIINTSVGSD